MKFEVREQLIQQIEFNPVVPRIGADFARIGDLGLRNKFFNLIADVANLVVFLVAANVDGLVVNSRFRCIHESNKSPGDVSAMNQGAPRRAVRHDTDFAGGDCAGQ